MPHRRCRSRRPVRGARVAQLQKVSGGDPLSVVVIEKGREAGAHMLSGAVLNPSSLSELVPDFLERGAPLETPVTHDEVYFLSATPQDPAAVDAAALRNHGNYVISLSRFAKWLAGLVESEGIDLFFGFAGSEVLFEGDRVVGVRTGRSRRGEARRTQGDVRGWSGHPGEGHDLRRWRPRQPHEAGAATAASRGRVRARAVRRGRQGTLGSSS